MLNKKVASEVAVGVILFIAVVVGGVFWMQNKKVKNTETPVVVDVQKQAVKSPLPTQPADETADWQTYKNDKYGYEIRYPKNWNYKIENGMACFRENGKTYNMELSDVCGISISETTNADKQRSSVENWIKVKKGGGGEIVVSNVKVGGSDAVQVQDYLGLETILSKKDGNALEIDFATPNFGSNDLNAPIKAVYDKMLSTFTFVGHAGIGYKNETVNWQAYKNDKYGFSIKFPSVLNYGEFEISKDVQNSAYLGDAPGHEVFNFGLAKGDPGNTISGIGITVKVRENNKPVIEPNAVEETIQIDGQTAVKHSGSYYVEKNGFIYSIFSYGDGDSYYYNMLKEIIPTFKFTK